MEERAAERREYVLTDKDVDRIISRMIPVILEKKNIDLFAAAFEERWSRYFFIGLGKGIYRLALRGMVWIIFFLAGYGMSKDWKLFG